jgi:formylglycine-generating enzyme required for sulfatase activity
MLDRFSDSFNSILVPEPHSLDLMRRKRAEHGFTGQLGNFALLDIIQMGCLAQRDGRLSIRNGRRRAEVILSRGRIVHAATEGRVGEDALLEILSWEKGEFQFGPTDLGSQSDLTIRGGWEQVLMDAVRKRDELRSAGSIQSREPALPTDQNLADGLLTRIETQRKRVRRAQLLKRVWLAILLVTTASSVAYIVTTERARLAEYSGKLKNRVTRLMRRHLQWQRRAAEQVLVPGGEFIYQDGERLNLRPFVIDSTEVTVWDYADFLRAIGSDTRFDHPNQKPHKGHSNPDWETYSRAALAGEIYHGVRLNPSFPAVYVDWFDAYAFAGWKGRRLLTELEWEKAGRGGDGRRYPWGTDMAPNAANLLGSLQTGPSLTEVRAWKRDRSSYGVYDMAGNVSEWTASDDGQGNPVIRGGNFRSDNAELTRRILHLSRETKDERIGFRTASDGQSRE